MTFAVTTLILLALWGGYDFWRWKNGKRTFTNSVYRWSVGFPLLKYIIVFVFGYLTCHFFECF